MSIANKHQGNIKEYHLPNFKEKIEILNKRARKLGCEEIQFIVGEKYILRTEKGWKQPASISTMLPITITLPTIKIADWIFAARLEPINTESSDNIAHLSPLYKGTIEERFRTTGTICEHCEHNRRRKDTFVLYNTVTGEQKQVGRQCLKDFLGHDPSKALNFWNFTNDLDVDGLFFDKTWREFIEVDPQQVLALAVAYRRLQGAYVSTKYGNEIENPVTGYLVKRHFTGDSYASQFAHATIEDEDFLEAMLVRQFAMNLSSEAGDEYNDNIARLAKSEAISERSIVYLVSVIASYWKAKKDKFDVENMKHVGIVGQKSTFDLTVKKIVTMNGYYGTSYLYVCSDDEKNNIIYKGTSSVMPEKIGEKIKIIAMVSEHTTFANKPQTIIKRPKKVA